MSDGNITPTWPGHARRNSRRPGEFLDVHAEAHPRLIAACGLDTEVVITSDPDGDYLGWIDSDDQTGVPCMIQWHSIFDVQFPYGHAASQERGQGRVVRLSVYLPTTV